MPINPLFWFLIAAAGVTTAASVAINRRSNEDQSPLEEGRVPGYSRTSGDNVSVDASVVPLKGGDWEPRRLETFHSNQRSRLLLSLEVERDDGTDLQRFLKRVGREVQTRTEASVVYLEANVDDEGRERLLYAPDGLGWTGNERVRMAWQGCDGETRWE